VVITDEVVEFAWAPAKSERNARTRRLPFDLAIVLFDGSVLERIDRRRDYRELRMIVTGWVGRRLLTCVCTDRWLNGRPVRRIIAWRVASLVERRRYANGP
jgi:uncharacterized DUF497 family protein